MTPREECRCWLRGASSIAVLTGAGISAESGIPTFRSSSGESALPPLWKKFRPEELATPAAFARDPVLVWRWYDWRRGLVARAKPNAGHVALAELERRGRRLTIVTQNVDGLHGLAGNRDVHEIHGSIWMLRCTVCGNEWNSMETPLPHIPPACPCGGMARPGVVWFGEGIPGPAWLAAETAAVTCGVLLVVGTSAVVYPASSLVPIARSAGARIIEINLEDTAASNLVDHSLRARAGEALPDLLDF